LLFIFQFIGLFILMMGQWFHQKGHWTGDSFDFCQSGWMKIEAYHQLLMREPQCLQLVCLMKFWPQFIAFLRLFCLLYLCLIDKQHFILSSWKSNFESISHWDHIFRSDCWLSRIFDHQGGHQVVPSLCLRQRGFRRWWNLAV